ncbi:MAG: hemin-degrading factor [Myxococcales bacterium]|nr:hemin-degrading factor [Myxococcales bacterium]
MTSLYEQYADLKAKGSKLHPRDAARALQGTEAELVASMPHSRRLGGTPQALVRALGTLGDAKTMTRNELAVIEKWGRFEEIDAEEGVMMGQVVGEDLDLRLFFSHWQSWFFVEEPQGDTVRTSLQVFDKRGDSAFKVFAESEESRKALLALAEAAGAAPATPLLAGGVEPERRPSGDQNVDVEAFWAEWDAMQNTHEFFGLLRKYGLARVRALELAGTSRAREVEPNALELLLEAAAGAGQPIMVFVGSRGVIQIHTGPVHTIKRMGGYLNVLDRGFNLHVKDEGIKRAFVVRKPTADGDVTSLELYDADGETVALLFSKRKPGQIEVEPWREMLRALPGRGQS